MMQSRQTSKERYTIFGAAKRFVRVNYAVFEYFLPKGKDKKEITEQYPDPVSSNTAEDLPKKSRGFLYNDIEQCTACNDCASVCPSRCITVQSSVISEVKKTWISKFDIDYSKCIFCGLCVEVCKPESLKHTGRFEGAINERKDFMESFGMGELSEIEKNRWKKIREQEEQNQW